MQASFLLEEATMEVLLLPLQRRDLCASALCCVGGDATEEEEGKMEQLTLEEASEEYKAFVDKFKPKLTTDDCYTPPNIYETVKEWVFEHYNLDKSTKVIRPFYPGGNYEHAEYPEQYRHRQPAILHPLKNRKILPCAWHPLFLVCPRNCLFQAVQRITLRMRRRTSNLSKRRKRQHVICDKLGGAFG